jgi:hypothetical protein
MPDAREFVASAVGEVRERLGIRVSEPAAGLLQLVLDAVVNDAHPRWGTTPGSIGPDGLRVFQDFYGRALPLLITQVAAQEPAVRDTGQITTFDLLHWLSGRIDFLCIIPK